MSGSSAAIAITIFGVAEQKYDLTVVADGGRPNSVQIRISK
ncbi:MULTISPECIES: hypothetical protein [unclassified Microcoleus]